MSRTDYERFVKACKAHHTARAAKEAARRKKKYTFGQLLARVKQLTTKLKNYAGAGELLCREQIGRPQKQRRLLQRALKRLFTRRQLSRIDLRSCAVRNWVVREIRRAIKGKARTLIVKVRDTIGYG